VTACALHTKKEPAWTREQTLAYVTGEKIPPIQIHVTSAREEVGGRVLTTIAAPRMT